MRWLLVLVVIAAVAGEVITVWFPASSPGFESSVRLAAYVTTSNGAEPTIEVPTEEWFRALFLSKPVVAKALVSSAAELFSEPADNGGDSHSKIEVLRESIEGSISFEPDASHHMAGVLMTVRLRSNNSDACKSVLGDMVRGFVEVIETQQQTPTAELITKLETTREEDVFPQLEQAERQYLEFRERQHFQGDISLAADKEKQLRKEVERLRRLEETLAKKLGEMLLETDSSRLVVEVVSDGVTTAEVPALSSQAIIAVVRVVVIVVAIAYGLFEWRRRVPVITNQQRRATVSGQP